MVRIVIDSTSDIPKETREKLGFIMVPLTVHFGEEAFKDGVEITHSEFYSRLKNADKLPTTSQVNPNEFEEVFKKIIDDGDDIVCLCLSSELSGTYGSAVIAAGAISPDRIFCVDTKSATFGTYLIIKEALKMRDMGLSAKEIAEKSRQLAGRIRFIAVVDTLKYLKMGGRISAAAATLGGLLSIHPIIEIREGKVEVIGKVKGRKAAFSKLLELYLEKPADFSHGFAFGHSNAPERLVELMDFFAPYVKTEDVITSDVGSVIGTHAGPGALGYAYIPEK